MCQDSSARLTGVRANVAKIPTANAALATSQMMNKYGGVATSGITCQSFTLDYENGEYVTSVDFSYDASAIRGIRATSNLGTTL